MGGGRPVLERGKRDKAYGTWGQLAVAPRWELKFRCTTASAKGGNLHVEARERGGSGQVNPKREGGTK